ncbi:DUF6444 domain-containing protein [Blautia obeum]|nr:DUF6444 domain-containing protein [Blautia obeum]MCB7341679.1 DUF6444 domain-containing protein [Blautia obeum]
MDIDLKEEIRKQDELLAEYLRVIEIQKGLIQELKKMEKRALDAEKQRDDALDKAKEIRLQYYETAAELEEERGKNLKLRAQINRDYKNSSIPSSKSIKRKKIANSREKTGRKPGGQPGHPGHHRKKTGTHTAGHPSSCT